MVVVAAAAAAVVALRVEEKVVVVVVTVAVCVGAAFFARDQPCASEGKVAVVVAVRRRPFVGIQIQKKQLQLE